MAKKPKCSCPKPGPSAPFFMLTYGDMMTLLMCFFVLLFAMSTIEKTKFQSQVAIMQGSLGISKFYRHAPIQQHLPSPSIKQSTYIKTKADISPRQSRATDQSASPSSFDPHKGEYEGFMRSINALGIQGRIDVSKHENELILTLPNYGVFEKGSHKINTASPEVQRVKKLYSDLASEIAVLTNYDIEFIGHTDALPFVAQNDPTLPKSNMELGFMRTVTFYEFFFSKNLPDKTRITFASRGDNVPIIPNATLDSERRKNRRVEIRLKKKFL